jgi:uncharacterized protein (TIGR02246 family)
MKPLRLFSALLLASSALLLGCHTQENNASSETEIRQWLDSFKHAFDARDAKAVMALYTPDVIAYDIVPPLQYKGADAYGKDFATFFSQYQGPMDIEFQDCRITSSGDLAIVSCLNHVTGTLTNGQTSSVWLRDTTALHRVNGQWLDFHDHVSAPTDFDTGKSRLDLTP